MARFHKAFYFPILLYMWRPNRDPTGNTRWVHRVSLLPLQAGRRSNPLPVYCYDLSQKHENATRCNPVEIIKKCSYRLLIWNVSWCLGYGCRWWRFSVLKTEMSSCQWGYIKGGVSIRLTSRNWSEIALLVHLQTVQREGHQVTLRNWRKWL
jgi:hypothetical protein